ncbi:MAG: hypothetical protein Q4G10_06460 [Bacteroidia bacterium]|nr:hypothetical protein [Bacteroidia bacterium]
MLHSLPKEASLQPADLRKDTSIYRLKSGNFLNEYYIVSSPGTRKLMASPEVVGFDSYKCMLPSTEVALDYLKESGLSDDISILTILRGGLNYPLEECCHNVGITVKNMNFVSCERKIEDGVITGLDIRYEKLHAEKDCTLMIGDIIASGDTLRLCLEQVVDRFRRRGGSIRKIIFFTIGGTKAITLMEKLTTGIQKIWPNFVGFQCIFYEGIFSVYEDKGCTGINIPNIDFYWKDGVISPDFRYHVLKDDDALFEKCIIYDGGARRYEIPEHYEEVMKYWEDVAAVAVKADYKAFLQEKIGHPLDINFEDWLTVNHYGKLDEEEMTSLFIIEREFLRQERCLSDIAAKRIREFKEALDKYVY